MDNRVLCARSITAALITSCLWGCGNTPLPPVGAAVAELEMRQRVNPPPGQAAVVLLDGEKAESVLREYRRRKANPNKVPKEIHFRIGK